MKHGWLSLCLSLLLVLGQQGAVLHELSHQAGDPVHPSQGKPLPQDKLCDQCVAYAGMGAAAVAAGPAVAGVDAGFALASYLAHGRQACFSAAYLSRAPPSVPA
jgi:hypothetical protein